MGAHVLAVMYDLSCVCTQETVPVKGPGISQSQRNMYNFIYCRGKGAHLSHLPRIGIQCFATETNGCEFLVMLKTDLA